VRKIKEVLRLHALGLSQRQIALSLCRRSGDGFRLPEGRRSSWFEMGGRRRLGRRPIVEGGGSISGDTPADTSTRPDYAAILHELQTNKHVTLQLLWEEYREQSPAGYRYSRYCDLYRGWLRRRQVVLRHEHRAGEKLFVDYAGATIPIHNAGTGEVWPAALFVAVLGASSYTYAEASLSQGLADWIGAHMRAFEFMGGVPEIVYRTI
jgi:transposase